METNETRAAVDALLAQHGVTMSATFVPQSASRHSQEKDRTLNWRIAFKRVSNGASFAIDYSQGVGHIPKIIGKSYPMEMQAREWEASEKGRYQARANSSFATKPLPPPSAANILYCITSDASCIDDTFEDFCANLGYDTDSRKAEAIYNACRAQTRDAQRVLGRDLLDAAAKLLEGY